MELDLEFLKSDRSLCSMIELFAAGLGVYATELGIYAIHVILIPFLDPANHRRCLSDE